MYPTLTDLIRDIFGIYVLLPFPIFGLFVALAFLIASYILTRELKRKEAEGLIYAIKNKIAVGKPASVGEWISSGTAGFVFGFKLVGIVWQYQTFATNPAAFILSLQGNILGGLLGSILALSLTYYQKEKGRTQKTIVVEQTIYPHEYVGEMTFIAGVAGMSGARLFHYLENIEQLIADPMGSLLSTGGFSIYGGLIIGGIAVLWYVYRKGLSPTHVADASAPALMLAYGVGRIGCHISGDGDWGLPNDAPIPAYLGFLPEWIWAYSYPNNVLGIDLQKDFTNMGLESLTGKAWPTPLYEAIASILLFICLWSIRNRVKAPGVMFSIYLILNGLERFLIEKIRINPPYSFWGIEATQAELISITFMVGGIFGVLYLSRLQRYSRLSKEGSLK